MAASCRQCRELLRSGYYAFDMWMARTFPHIPFERYADDAICHCKKRRGGAGAMECTCRSLCGGQAGVASREDEDRLLQGCEPAWRLPEPVVRLSWLHVSSQEDDVARSDPNAPLHARRQSKGVEVH